MPPRSTLGPWLYPSPHSRQPEYRLQGEQTEARKGSPHHRHSCLPGLGPAPSVIGPSFLLTELVWMRATCRSAWLGAATRLLFRLLRLHGHPGRELYHKSVSRCLWRAKHAWVPFWPLGALLLLWSEGRPSHKRGSPRLVSRSADWDCQGWGQQGSCAFVHRARASSFSRSFLSAGWKPRRGRLLGAGMEGAAWPS